MSKFMNRFAANDSGEKIQDIDIGQIHVNTQVRKDIDDTKVNELAESINKIGLQSPIKLRREDNKYIVLYGHRRLAACKQLGKKTIPCFVTSKPMTEEEIIVHQYAENEQRENLNALEKINVYLELKERGLTGKKIAQELSVSPAQITQGLKAGELPQEWLKKAVKACPDVSIYKLYNIAKIKTDRRREQSFNALINGVEVKSTPKEQEKPVKNEKFYTDAQLNFAWEKIKRKVRRDKQQLAKLIPPGKLDKFLEDYDLNED